VIIREAAMVLSLDWRGALQPKPHLAVSDHARP
jgi:hypothetical protein